MTDYGFERSALADIEHIKKILKDCYRSGFSVVKELIQNSEDAEDSQTALFMLVEGVPGAQQPLLLERLLLVVNDGDFSQDDADAIRQMGLSNKRAKKASIGKYGLGLKSIFHLCEAFFYVSHNTNYVASGFLNPWGKHQDRGGFSLVDADAIKRLVSETTGLSRFFALAIPLRKKEHCKLPAIVKEYPGDDPIEMIVPSDFVTNVAVLFPMLRNVKSIGFSVGKSTPLFDVNLGVGASTRKYPDCITDGHILSGRVETHGCREITYEGLEVLLDDGQLAAIKSSAYWPVSTTLNHQKELVDVPEKADPHCAVYFMREVNPEKSGLNIQWASFLPLSDSYESQKCSGSCLYHLVLHGYFFLDSGRNKILFSERPEQMVLEPSSEEEANLLWNHGLAERGTLPLVIQALSLFSSTISVIEASLLTESLQKSKFFERYKEFVCKNESWFCCINGQGVDWRSIERKQPVYELPKGDSNLAVRVLPKLKDIAKSHNIVISDTPSLSFRKSLSQWTEDLALALLDSVAPKEVFSSPEAAAYFADFAELLKRPSWDEGVEKRLISIIGTGFATSPIKALMNCRDQIGRILAWLRPEKVVALSRLRMDDQIRFFREFMQHGLDLVVLPYEFAEYAADPNDLNGDLGCALLEVVYSLAANDFKDYHARVFLQIVAMTRPGDWTCRISNLPVFKANDLRQKKDVFLSLEQIRQHSDSGSIMVYSNRPWRDLASEMQSVVVNASFYAVPLELCETGSLGLGQLPQFIEPVCRDFLQRTPAPLIEPDAARRLRLLQLLASDIAEPVSLIDKRALRYLLHAEPTAVNDNTYLFVSDAHVSDLWGTIAVHLQQQTGNSWQMIDSQLCNEIAPRIMKELDVRRMDKEGVIATLKAQNGASIDWTFLREDQRDELCLQVGDDEVLKSLNLHQDIQGEFIVITDGNTFLEGDYIPKVLGAFEGVKVIRKSPNPIIHARQKQLAPTLTGEVVVELALAKDNPSEFSESILEALNLYNTAHSLTESVKDKLANVKWMKAANDRVCAPREVLYLKEMDLKIHAILKCLPDRTYFTILDVDSAITAHPSFEKVKPLFPWYGEAIRMLAQELSGIEQFALGRLPVDADLTGVVRTLAGAPEKVMDIAPLLNALLSSGHLSGPTSTTLLPSLLGNVDLPRLVRILNYLSWRHKVEADPGKTTIEGIFNLYIETLVSADAFRKVIPSIELLNRNRSWKKSSELSLDAPGIVDDDLLDIHQGKLLAHMYRQVVKIADEADLSPHSDEPPKSVANTLRRYFASWQGKVPSVLIGGLLAILGGDAEVEKFAVEMLGSHSLEPTRRIFGIDLKLGWQEESVERYIRQHRFEIDVMTGRSIRVNALTGGTFEGRLMDDAVLTSLVVGDFTALGGGGYKFTLREVDPYLQEGKLSSLLKETVREIFKEVYWQKGGTIDQAWDLLSQTGQLDIAVARNLILGACFFYLKQMKLGQRNHTLRVLLDRWDSLRMQLAENETYLIENLVENDGTTDRLNAEIKGIINDLQAAIEHDVDVQSTVLESVRRKVKEYQYEHSSIPFELFQNADDAMLEFEALDGTRACGSFVVEALDDTIMFMHWGRLINQYRTRPGGVEVKGYARDLERMLVLSSSEKAGEEVPVTGKFGLGFKSVYLVSDRPKLLSGNLGFEVVGGMFPRRLESGDFKLLSEALSRHEGDKNSSGMQQQGTATLLELKTISARDVVSSFSDLVGILLVFAQRIKRCVIIGLATAPAEYEVLTEPLIQRAAIVEFSRPTSLWSGVDIPHRGLFIGDQTSSILFGVGRRGIVPFPAHVPSLWVTAPTQETTDTGIVVNGRFAVDVGRSRLANGAGENSQTAVKISRAIAETLPAVLKDATGNWDSFKEKFHLDTDVDQYDFWESFFKVVTGEGIPRNDAEYSAAAVIKQCLWGLEGELRAIMQSCNLLPSGLGGQHRLLTCMNQIDFVVSGLLLHEDIFDDAMALPAVANRCQSGRAIHFGYFERLSGFFEIGVERPVAFSLADAIVTVAETNDYRIDEIVASKLAKTLNERVRGMLDKSLFEAESVGIARTLKLLHFADVHGIFRGVGELLIDSNPEDDETMRAKFAPDSRVLSPAYQGGALEFFRYCRSKMKASAEEMACWGKECHERGKQKAFLRYLLSGEIGRQVMQELRGKVSGTWIQDLEGLEFWDYFNSWEQTDLLVGLRLREPIYSVIEPDIKSDPKETLEALYGWWQLQKDSEISKYHANTYPAGVFPTLSFEILSDEREARKGWLTLFMLGAFHTIGLATPDQHRGFITLCEKNGWMDIFVDGKERSLENWMAVVKRYLGDQVQDVNYYQWMKEFVSVFVLSYWLDEYVEAFLAVDKISKPFSLSQITCSKSSEVFQLGGLEAPPVNRTLGMGACFVIRELTRNQIINNPLAYEYCFVPREGVRRFMSGLGCDGLLEKQDHGTRSRIIFNFLKKHLGEEKGTFGGCFDLALNAIAYNVDLQNEYCKKVIVKPEEIFERGL